MCLTILIVGVCLICWSHWVLCSTWTIYPRTRSHTRLDHHSYVWWHYRCSPLYWWVIFRPLPGFLSAEAWKTSSGCYRFFDHVTWFFHGNQVLTGGFTQIWYFSLIFSFHEISGFYKEFFPKSLNFLHPYVFFDFFQIKFGDFQTFLNNLEIQDGGSKMALICNCIRRLFIETAR